MSSPCCTRAERGTDQPSTRRAAEAAPHGGGRRQGLQLPERTRSVRAWLRAHHIQPVIPERRDQRERRTHRPGRKPAFDRAAYRRRNVIERAGGLLKEARAIATRFDKLATQYRATVMLGMLELYLALPLANTPWGIP